MGIFPERCEQCNTDMSDTCMDFLVEAMETFNLILCDDCFEELCEEQS